MRFVIAAPNLRDGRVVLTTLALLAIGASLAMVVHDLNDRLPFWWTHDDVRAHVQYRLGLPGADPAAELRDLPVHDRRGMDVLVECLASRDDEVRRAARKIAHEHLDRWQLADTDRALWLAEQFVEALLHPPAKGSRAYPIEAAELAQRALRPAWGGLSRPDPSFVDNCERLIRQPADSKHQATQPAGHGDSHLPDSGQSARDRPAAPAGSGSFEDQFGLPGGQLPVITLPRAGEQVSE